MIGGRTGIARMSCWIRVAAPVFFKNEVMVQLIGSFSLLLSCFGTGLD